MTIHTSQGDRVETLEFRGRSTPYLDVDRYVVLKVAVNGKPYPSFQLPAEQWEKECATTLEPEFWQNVADAARSIADSRRLMQNRA